MKPNDKELMAWRLIEDECKPFGGYVKVLQECGGTTVSQIWIRAMDEYASIKLQQANKKIAELNVDVKNLRVRLQETIDEKLELYEFLKPAKNLKVEELQEQLKAKDELIKRLKNTIKVNNKSIRL